jgi:hypothetical protein
MQTALPSSGYPEWSLSGPPPPCSECMLQVDNIKKDASPSHCRAYSTFPKSTVLVLPCSCASLKTNDETASVGICSVEHVLVRIQPLCFRTVHYHLPFPSCSTLKKVRFFDDACLPLIASSSLI